MASTQTRASSLTTHDAKKSDLKNVPKSQSIVIANGVDRIPNPVIFKFISSAKPDGILVSVSIELLAMKSSFFETIARGRDIGMQEQDECKSADEVVAIHVGDAEEAVKFITYIHAQFVNLKHSSTNPLVWNKTWASLSCMWLMDDFIDEFAKLGSDRIQELVYTKCTNCANIGILNTQKLCTNCCRSRNAYYLPNAGQTTQAVATQFWEIASTILAHDPMKKSASFNRSEMIKILSKIPELRNKLDMIMHLTKEDLVDLCLAMGGGPGAN